MNLPSINERLAANHFETDETSSHIHIDQEVARATNAARILIAVCPAGVYRQEDDGSISVEYAACLECGACLAVAPPGSLAWHYPSAGYGVHYREG